MSRMRNRYSMLNIVLADFTRGILPLRFQAGSRLTALIHARRPLPFSLCAPAKKVRVPRYGTDARMWSAVPRSRPNSIGLGSGEFQTLRNGLVHDPPGIDIQARS
jgi:hypothetical protein